MFRVAIRRKLWCFVVFWVLFVLYFRVLLDSCFCFLVVVIRDLLDCCFGFDFCVWVFVSG